MVVGERIWDRFGTSEYCSIFQWRGFRSYSDIYTWFFLKLWWNSPFFITNSSLYEVFHYTTMSFRISSLFIFLFFWVIKFRNLKEFFWVVNVPCRILEQTMSVGALIDENKTGSLNDIHLCQRIIFDVIEIANGIVFFTLWMEAINIFKMWWGDLEIIDIDIDNDTLIGVLKYKIWIIYCDYSNPSARRLVSASFNQRYEDWWNP